MLRNLLDGTDAGAGPTPRQVLKLTTEGGIPELVAEIGRAAQGGDVSSLFKLLVLIQRCCRTDAFFAAEFGVLGGFQGLVKASAWLQEHEEHSDALESLDATIGAIVCSGCTSYPRVPLEPSWPPLSYVFRDAAAKTFGVVLRRVGKDFHFDQSAVGYVLWSAAIIQSRWLCAHPSFALDQDVLELGAGVGLSGIVASRLARICVLTDFNDAVIANLAANVRLNAGEEDVFGLPCATAPSCRVSVRKLDWTQFQQEKSVEEGGDENSAADWLRPLPGTSFERIVGSDIICCAEDVPALCGVLSHFLARTSTARCNFIVPTSDHRWGIQDFVPALLALGLDVKHRPLLHSRVYKDAEYTGRARFANLRRDYADGSQEDGQGDGQEDDDEADRLLEGIDEAEYFVWQIISCKWAAVP